MTGAFLVLPSKKSTEKKLLGIHTWKKVLEVGDIAVLFIWKNVSQVVYFCRCLRAAVRAQEAEEVPHL